MGHDHRLRLWVRPVPKINAWRRRSLPFAAIPSRPWQAWAPRPVGRMSSTRASRGKPTTSFAGGPMVPRSSALPSAIAACLGLRGCDAGWREYARWWRPCMRSSGIPSASTANGPMTSADFRRAWPQKSRCIMFVSGSMSNSADHALLLRTWWPGNLREFHTKRLSDVL